MKRPEQILVRFAAAVVLVQVAVTVAFNDIQWTAPVLLFWGVVIAASLCFVAAICLMALAHRNQQAELGFVALFFVSASLLPLVHGITTPGVLYAQNSATAASVFWAVPVGIAAMSPGLLRSHWIGRSIAARWQRWAVAWILIMAAISGTMLVSPNLVPVPEMGSRAAIASAFVFLAATILAAWRHARLAQIAQHNGPLVVAFGYVLVGSSVLVFISGPPYAPHFWLAHALDIGGVFLATIGGVVVYLRTGNSRSVIAPVVAVDPHAALELGLSPLVHEFVADLETKDQITRDHVVRCASLAVELAGSLGLRPSQLRQAGLVGLLHDVGKLRIPDDILKKPGRLSDPEMAVIQTHSAVGFDLLIQSPGLEPLAPLVRSHHERIDGRGYPDELQGDQIPLIARLIAVCDAFDAMTMTRQYREGMPIERAHAILREHAGSQWDEEMVAALILLTSTPGRSVAAAPALGSIGREEGERMGCGCLPVVAELPSPSVALRRKRVVPVGA